MPHSRQTIWPSITIGCANIWHADYCDRWSWRLSGNLSVTQGMCKNGWTDRRPVWAGPVETLGDPRNAVVDVGEGELVQCGLCQITLHKVCSMFSDLIRQEWWRTSKITKNMEWKESSLLRRPPITLSTILTPLSKKSVNFCPLPTIPNFSCPKPFPGCSGATLKKNLETIALLIPELWADRHRHRHTHTDTKSLIYERLIWNNRGIAYCLLLFSYVEKEECSKKLHLCCLCLKKLSTL